MSDDLLERATSALRETTTDPAPELARARERARLLAAARARRGTGLRPQTVWQWAAVLLLGFFVSTAMAHVIRVEVPKLWRALREPEPSQARPAHGKKAGTTPGQSAQPATAAPAQPVNAPEASAELAQVAQLPVQEPAVQRADVDDTQAAAGAPRSSQPPAAQTRGRGPASARTDSPPRAQRTAADHGRSQLQTAPTAPGAGPALPPAPAEPADLALFRKAQALHLAHDPRAIEAWDAYLRAADQGALVPEARYNRALCLVRAGRHAEARSALAPFAEGAFAGYRQREAQALLSRLPE
jgi:hypothetical protein